MKSESEVAQSCPTLRDPMDCSLPGSSVHGIFLQEYWNGVPLPSPSMLHTDSQILRKNSILNTDSQTLLLKSITQEGAGLTYNRLPCIGTNI